MVTVINARIWECAKYLANSSNSSHVSLTLGGQGADRSIIGCVKGVAFAQPIETRSFLVAPLETRLDADGLAIRVFISEGAPRNLDAALLARQRNGLFNQLGVN